MNTKNASEHNTTSINNLSTDHLNTAPEKQISDEDSSTHENENIISDEKAPDLSSNYQHWRDEGHLWQDAYDGRKRTLAYYHIQELMLADYIIHSKPLRVLEYGCGVGRHLRYLSKLPTVEIYGYDQSQRMVSHIRNWASKEWFDSHVTVGLPVTQLPYEDNAFDIVFTSEVLIHVSPSDLEAVVKELLRVAKWQVLHLEPAPSAFIAVDAHNGSWNHDLVSLYQKLGYMCETLPSGFASQTPYRVVCDVERATYTWSPVMLSLFRRLEEDLQPSLNRAQLEQNLQHTVDVLASQFAGVQTELQVVANDLANQQAYANTLQQQLDEAHTIAALHATQRDEAKEQVQLLMAQRVDEQTQHQELIERLTHQQHEQQQLINQLSEQLEQYKHQEQLAFIEQEQQQERHTVFVQELALLLRENA